MTSKPTTGKGSAEGQRAASKARNDIVGEIASKALQRAPNGTLMARVTDDDLTYALDRIAAGDGVRNVAARLDVSRSYFHERASRDPDFAARLRAAQEAGAFAIVENTLNIAAGGDLSSGSIERDKLMCDVAWKWGKTIGNRIFGDRLQVDQRSITIQIKQDDTEW